MCGNRGICPGIGEASSLLVFFCTDEAGLVHESGDGVGFVCVLGYFVYDPHGGE